MTDEVFYHLAGQRLGPGSIILPGNFVRIVEKIGQPHNALDREAALESWRAANAPQLPSRGHSVFAFDHEVAARLFRQNEPGFPFHLLYRVVPVEPTTPIYRTRIADFRPRSPFDHDWPARYWRADQAAATEAAVRQNEAMSVGPEAREVLIGGPVRVEACLD